MEYNRGMNKDEVSRNRVNEMGEQVGINMNVIHKLLVLEEGIKSLRETVQEDLKNSMGQWVID